MLRLKFTLDIWRVSLDKLFQILTPFLEKVYFKLACQSVKDCCAKWFAFPSLNFCSSKNRTVGRSYKILKTKINSGSSKRGRVNEVVSFKKLLNKK